MVFWLRLGLGAMLSNCRWTFRPMGNVVELKRRAFTDDDYADLAHRYDAANLIIAEQGRQLAKCHHAFTLLREAFPGTTGRALVTEVCSARTFEPSGATIKVIAHVKDPQGLCRVDLLKLVSIEGGADAAMTEFRRLVKRYLHKPYGEWLNGTN
jgi:hypothetical protein